MQAVTIIKMATTTNTTTQLTTQPQNIDGINYDLVSFMATKTAGLGPRTKAEDYSECTVHNYNAITANKWLN